MGKKLWGVSGLMIILFTGIFSNWNAAAEIHNTSISATVRSHSSEKENKAYYSKFIGNLYDAAQLADADLAPDVFERAVTGFYNLKKAHKLSDQRSILTIIDFDKSSAKKRLWIIDLDKKELLFHTLVAHGQGSGNDKASRFSNKTGSHESSLGFYITGETYYGEHGLSLKLDGVDKGFNTNARSRAIVVHGADYVSRDFVDEYGRLGRSFGCPAVPSALSDDIINIIKNKTVLFINGPSSRYYSKYLNKQHAADFLLSLNGWDDNGSDA